MTSTTSVPPVTQQLQQALTATAKTRWGKEKALWDSLFSSTLAAANGSLFSSTALSSAASGTSLVSQLTSAVKKGTPISTIVDRIAQSVGTAAGTQLQGSYAPSDLARLRTRITKTIANALSPPSNAPPGDAEQEASTLAARLRGIVESIARDATTESGQQNELSGSNLDANSAKEAPAQQTNETGTSSTLGAAALARSLMTSALSALTASTPASSTAAQTAAASQAAHLTALTNAASPAVLSATQQPSTSTAQPQQPQRPQQPADLTMTNAPDLLARMIVRAASAATQTASQAISTAAGDAASAASSASSAVTSAAASAAGTLSNLPTLSPASIAAKFAALIADASAGSVVAGSSSGDTSTSFNSGHSFGQSFAQQQTPLGTNSTNVIAGPSASLTSHVQNALQESTTTPYASVDANKVVEQMINSMTMRTLAQGTSEIRLQLQPENLGQVTMRLTVSGNQVNANVVAQNADVGNALIAGHRELARSLSQSGLALSGFSVDVSGGDAGRDQGKDRTAGFGRRYTVHELSGASAAAETAESSSVGPSILYGSKLELFNSLA